MGIHNRFFGKREADDRPDDLLAFPKKGDRPGLQVLFADDFRLEPAAVTRAMRAYHPSMARARFEVMDDLNKEGKVFGLAGWGEHVIQLVGFDAPMPEEAVEKCVAPSHYGQKLKDEARRHRAHILLWYAGKDESPLEQFVTLAALAGTLERFGALVVLNESGRTSFPAAALSAADAEGDLMESLRTLPAPALYCGFVKYNVPNDKRVWMRTYGAHILGLPDFAAYTKGHHEGQHYFDMFDSIFRYMLDSGKRLAPGHTMQIGAEDYLRCRAPRKDESWLQGDQEVLVAEMIRADEINR
ncbi:MAG: DUF4261 domain-containing protein [Gemmataceae bacterium]